MARYPTPPLFLLFALLGGCAQYEFNLTEPPNLARHVARNEPTTFSSQGLDYRLQAAEGRLVMQISNPGDQPVQLVGEQSYIVTPDKQSHPVRGQTIAPRSFIKLILPPMRPVYRAGPTFGGGTTIAPWYGGPPWYPDYAYDTPLFVYPQYFDIYDESTSAYYWDWNDQATINIRLTFRREKQNFEQDFTFRRVKMRRRGRA